MSESPTLSTRDAIAEALAASDFFQAALLAEESGNLSLIEHTLGQVPESAQMAHLRLRLAQAHVLLDLDPVAALTSAAALDREVSAFEGEARQAARIPPLMVMLQAAMVLESHEAVIDLAQALVDESLQFEAFDTAALGLWRHAETLTHLGRHDEALSLARRGVGYAQRVQADHLIVGLAALRARLCYQQGRLTETLEQFTLARRFAFLEDERAQLDLVLARIRLECGQDAGRQAAYLQQHIAQGSQAAQREWDSLEGVSPDGYLQAYSPRLALSGHHAKVFVSAHEQLNQGKPQEAIAFFDILLHALKAKGDATSAFSALMLHLHRAFALTEAQDLMGAQADAQHAMQGALALENMPLYAHAALASARLYVSQGQVAQAGFLLEEAHLVTSRFGSDSYAMLLAAQRALLVLDERLVPLPDPSVEQTLRRAQVELHRPTAERLLGLLGLAVVLDGQGHREQARHHLQAGMDLLPEASAEHLALVARVRSHLELADV